MGVIFMVAVVWLYLRWKNTPVADEKRVTKQTKKPELETVASIIKTPEMNKAPTIAPEDSILRHHNPQNVATQQAESNLIQADKKPPAKDLTESPIPKAVMPEEIELKRDVIQRLVAETEAAMSPRPTDSMLKRHHDTQLMSIVLSQLQAEK